MKFQRFETPADLRPIEPAAPADAPISQDPSIEELPGAAPVAAPRHSDRWLGITIAMCTALVCFGFVSHAAAPAPVPAPDDALARPSMPSPSAPAEPTPSRTPTLSGPTVDGSAGPNGESTSPSWQAQVVANGKGRSAVLVDGDCQTTIPSLTIRILTRSGRVVGTYTAPVVLEDERPASNGEPRTELGSFEREIALPNQQRALGFIVELAWHDRANGTSGTVRQRVPAPIAANWTIWEPNSSARSHTL